MLAKAPAGDRRDASAWRLPNTFQTDWQSIRTSSLMLVVSPLAVAPLFGASRAAAASRPAERSVGFDVFPALEQVGMGGGPVGDG